jgi:hypothetical protein
MRWSFLLPQKVRPSTLIYRYMPPTPQYSWSLINNRSSTGIKHERRTPVSAFKLGGILFMRPEDSCREAEGMSAPNTSHGISRMESRRRFRDLGGYHVILQTQSLLTERLHSETVRWCFTLTIALFNRMPQPKLTLSKWLSGASRADRCLPSPPISGSACRFSVLEIV